MKKLRVPSFMIPICTYSTYSKPRVGWNISNRFYMVLPNSSAVPPLVVLSPQPPKLKTVRGIGDEPVEPAHLFTDRDGVAVLESNFDHVVGSRWRTPQVDR